MEIANDIFNLELKILVLDSENDVKGGTTGPIQIEGGLKSVVVKYRLNFDNKDYVGIIRRRWKFIMTFIPSKS